MPRHLGEQITRVIAELHFVLTFCGEPNRCGVALLLKVLPYLGYSRIS
jgi:hypothetical protein